MPLAILPADPKPAEGDLHEDERVSISIRSRMARLDWENRVREHDPNAFLLRYASDVPNYEIYALSPEWRKIRRRVLKAHEHNCAGCFGKATEVHHRDYRPRVLVGEDLSPMVPLCKACHRAVHYDESKEKRKTWDECERVLDALVASKNVK